MMSVKSLKKKTTVVLPPDVVLPTTKRPWMMEKMTSSHTTVLEVEKSKSQPLPQPLQSQLHSLKCYERTDLNYLEGLKVCGSSELISTDRTPVCVNPEAVTVNVLSPGMSLPRSTLICANQCPMSINGSRKKRVKKLSTTDGVTSNLSLKNGLTRTRLSKAKLKDGLTVTKADLVVTTKGLPPYPPSVKKKKVVTRKKQMTCVICGITLRNDEPVCKKWKCEYYYTSERASYWLERVGCARIHLNMSRDGHVDEAGVGQMSGSCKCCDKLISVGCGEKDGCNVLCPWCVCDTPLCRNRIYEHFKWYNLSRRCFAQGCSVVIPANVLSVFGTNSEITFAYDDDGVKYISCLTCRDDGHPVIYCGDHSDHYYHEWEKWLPKKRKNSKKRKKCGVQLSPYSLPPMYTCPIVLETADIFGCADLSTLDIDETDIFDLQLSDF